MKGIYVLDNNIEHVTVSSINRSTLTTANRYAADELTILFNDVTDVMKQKIMIYGRSCLFDRFSCFPVEVFLLGYLMVFCFRKFSERI